MAIQHISPLHLQQQLQMSSLAFFLLDVREPFEYEMVALDKSLLIPMHQIPERITELNKSDQIVVICHHGVRSESVAYYLEEQGFLQVFNLTGGIHAWAVQCETDMALY